MEREASLAGRFAPDASRAASAHDSGPSRLNRIIAATTVRFRRDMRATRIDNGLVRRSSRLS